MTKYISIFVILCGAIITSSQCMITDLSFNPYIQVDNQHVREWRSEKKYRDLLIQVSACDDPNIRCLQYALQKITGVPVYIPFYGRADLDIPINHFFKQIEHPQPGCLVVYSTNKEFPMSNHFAIAIDTVTFESKFGENKEIVRHRLFDVPSSYGNVAWFFALKQEYKQNNPLLRAELCLAAMEQRLLTFSLK